MTSKSGIACMAICLALAACVSDNTDRTRFDLLDEAPAPGEREEAKPDPATRDEVPKKAPDAGSKPDPLPSSNVPQAPNNFSVKFVTTVGEFTIDATRDWSPRGVDRFHELVTKGFFNEVAFFRVIDGFIVQFGIHGDPDVGSKWRTARIADDEVKESNTRGAISFATGGPDTRTTQMFINFRDNPNLDTMGFSPFGRVSKGMDVVDKIYKTGEGAPHGQGPSQVRIHGEGNVYLKQEFPRLDYIQSATVVK